jgi:hypothetical protein
MVAYCSKFFISVILHNQKQLISISMSSQATTTL